jgi:peptidoglycan/LPS O-acetylase OafA/YrhL
VAPGVSKSAVVGGLPDGAQATRDSLARHGRSSYVPTLDGLRAVAIVGVIVAHAGRPFVDPFWGDVGHIPVLIFFALSGYLITTRLLDEYDATGRIVLRDFYIRRVFRILPPALLFLATIAFLAWIGVVDCDRRAIRSAVLLYTNYLGDEAGWTVGHFWSLSVEEHFYLFWPALLVSFGPSQGWRRALALILALVVWRTLDERYHVLGTLFHDPLLDVNDYRTDLIADTLLWGCILAFVLRSSRRFVLTSGQSMAVAGGSAALLAFLVLEHVRHATPLAHLLPTILVGAVVLAPQSPLGKFLETPPVRFLGRVSYSLYIWQQPFLGPSRPALPLAIAGAFVCAVISYALIEQPSIRFGRRLLIKGRQRRFPTAAAEG